MLLSHIADGNILYKYSPLNKIVRILMLELSANVLSIQQEFLYDFRKSLIAGWLGWASQEHDIYCHYLEVMSSNPSRVKLWVRSTSV